MTAMLNPKAAKLASQKPPGMVTVVLAYPCPTSVPTGVVADAHPHAPPAMTTASRSSVLALTPPTDIVRAAAGAPTSSESTKRSLSAGLPDRRRVGVIVWAIGSDRTRGRGRRHHPPRVGPGRIRQSCRMPPHRAVYLPPFGPFGDPQVLVDLAVHAE